MTAEAATALLDALEDADIHVWIDGGWAVDAVLGEQSREHSDLDVVVEVTDVPRLRALLGTYGFLEVPRPDTRPWNFVLSDPGGRQVDVHVIAIDEHGHGAYGPALEGAAYTSESLTGTGSIAGRHVRCIEPSWLLRFKSGYEPRSTDRHDVAALCARFGFEVPQPYRVAASETPPD
jgi:lincosamide nucleotidyltransferase A/C/D/E